jgi:hypothetical protein
MCYIFWYTGFKYWELRVARKKRTTKIGDILHTSGKVTRIGDSLYISLPKSWATEHDIKPGDRLVKVANSMLTVSPTKEV